MAAAHRYLLLSRRWIATLALSLAVTSCRPIDDGDQGDGAKLEKTPNGTYASLTTCQAPGKEDGLVTDEFLLINPCHKLPKNWVESNSMANQLVHVDSGKQITKELVRSTDISQQYYVDKTVVGALKELR